MTSVPFLNRTSRGQATATAVAATPAVMTSQYGTKSVRPHTDPLAPETTVDLLARAKRGDRSALDMLLERCIPALRRWAHARLPQSARGMVDTADMVQDTVVAALRRLDVFEARHEGALQAYLRTAVMNRIRDVIRQRDRRPLQGEMPEDLLDEATSPLEATDRRPERQLLRSGARTPAIERSRSDRRPHRNAIQLRRTCHRAEQTDSERSASSSRARAETPRRRDARCQLRTGIPSAPAQAARRISCNAVEDRVARNGICQLRD